MNLSQILQISKGLPPDNLHDMLFARKLPAVTTETVSGYPCVLTRSLAGNVRKYRIYGNENGVGELVTEGGYSGKYVIPVVTGGKNLFNGSDKHDAYITAKIGETNNYISSTSTDTFEKCVYVEKNKKYTISWNIGKPVSSNQRGSSIVDDNGIVLWFNEGFIRFDSNNKLRSFTAPVTGWLCLVLDKNCTDIQIETGETATEYESYCKPSTTNIYLDKPLETDEILKYPENVLEHSDGTVETVILPEIPTFNGTTIITTSTEIQPSDMEITYKARK